MTHVYNVYAAINISVISAFITMFSLNEKVIPLLQSNIFNVIERKVGV